MSTPAVPTSCTTLKNGDLSVVLHIPSRVATEGFKGIHPLLGTEIHVDIWAVGE